MEHCASVLKVPPLATEFVGYEHPATLVALKLERNFRQFGLLHSMMKALYWKSSEGLVECGGEFDHYLAILGEYENLVARVLTEVLGNPAHGGARAFGGVGLFSPVFPRAQVRRRAIVLRRETWG